MVWHNTFVVAKGSAPRSSKICITCVCPCFAAMCRAVSPSFVVSAKPRPRYLVTESRINAVVQQQSHHVRVATIRCASQCGHVTLHSENCRLAEPVMCLLYIPCSWLRDPRRGPAAAAPRPRGRSWPQGAAMSNLPASSAWQPRAAVVHMRRREDRWFDPRLLDQFDGNRFRVLDEPVAQLTSEPPGDADVQQKGYEQAPRESALR